MRVFRLRRNSRGVEELRSITVGMESPRRR
jgi:hypothetical protein